MSYMSAFIMELDSVPNIGGDVDDGNETLKNDQR